MAQIIGDAQIIKQHLTRTHCSSFINSSTGLDMCVPNEDKNKIKIWTDANQDETDVYSLGI